MSSLRACLHVKFNFEQGTLRSFVYERYLVLQSIHWGQRVMERGLKYRTGMNLLSKFCIAVSATQKLNCVAVGVICVAVFFFGVFWRRKKC